MSVLARWRRLPAPERADLWPAAWRLITVWVMLGVLGFSRSQRRLAADPSAAGESSNPAIWQRRARAIRRVGARLPRARCLARALCLWWWMRSAGLDAHLKMGIRRDERGQVAGHAWVEYRGAPIDETPAAVACFKPLRWGDERLPDFPGR